jgi:arylsulfatase A-like enzyme
MPPPNLLWIVTTQWRAQAFGFAGDPNARTPCLDRLAAQSVNYAQAVTPHPFGPFARVALMTGVASPENGVRNYFDPLPPGTQTIAHDLKARGYLTAFFGKWHLAQRDPAAPLVGDAHARMIVPAAARGGFEFWEGFESGFLLNDPWLHGSRLESPRQFTGYQSDVISDRVAAWWREQTPSPSLASSTISRPRFCMVSLEAPHPPYDAPAAGVRAQAAAGIILAANVPRGGPEEARARRELAGYYAHLEATDRALGRLLAAVSDDTVVIFTSVHGDMHGAHGLFRKGWPYEESVRVPLLMRRPCGPQAKGERREARPRSDAAISLVDLRVMTLDLASGLLPSASPLHAFISMPSVVALPHQCDRTWRGIRTKTRKLVLSADGLPWLFFDLERDPLEQQNLVSDSTRAAEIAELTSRLK